MIDHLREKTNEVIARMQLDNLAKLTNGRWFEIKILNCRGEQTTRWIIEFPTPKHSEHNFK